MAGRVFVFRDEPVDAAVVAEEQALLAGIDHVAQTVAVFQAGARAVVGFGALDPLDGGGAQVRASVQRAAAEHQQRQLRQVSRGDVQRPRRPSQDFDERLFLGASVAVALGQPIADLRFARPIGALHAERAGQAACNEVLKFLPADLFDNAPGDHRPRVAVRRHRAGLPAARVGPVLVDGLRQRNIFAFEQIVAEGNVVESRRVLDQVHDADRVGLFPGVVVFQFGHQIGKLCVEVELAFFDQHHNRDAGEAFGDGARAEDRFRGDRPFRFDVGKTIAFRKDDLPALDDGNACAGDFSFGECFSKPLVELFK